MVVVDPTQEQIDRAFEAWKEKQLLTQEMTSLIEEESILDGADASILDGADASYLEGAVDTTLAVIKELGVEYDTRVKEVLQDVLRKGLS